MPQAATAVIADDAPRFISPEVYLAQERLCDAKHEYSAGWIYAVAGATARHNRIAGNLYRELSNQLRGARCEAFPSDLQVKGAGQAGAFYYYPDVTVDCSSISDEATYTETPSVIIEVLSPHTERVDQGEKLLNYRCIPFLKVYVLVSQTHPRVAVHRRVRQEWNQEIVEGLKSSLELPEIGCSIPFSAIFERVDLEPVN
jgi:Uma2 family endonuclease